MSFKRFEVRRVNNKRRVYSFVIAKQTYHDACLVADVLRCQSREDVVVWDSNEKRVLYDSRKLTPLGGTP